MKNAALKVLLTAAVLIPVAFYAQPRPGNPTTATVITKAEIDKINATEQSLPVPGRECEGCRYRRRLEHGVGYHSSLLHPEPAARACRRGRPMPRKRPNYPVWRTNGKSAGGCYSGRHYA